MKVKNTDLEAAAYLFEFENGNDEADFRLDIINSSSIKGLNAHSIEKSIIDGLNSNYYEDVESRGAAYWALSKRFNKALIPLFSKWLLQEYKSNNEGGVFQLMIALDNLDEPIFNKERTGFAHYETELNYRDAKQYLNL